MEGNWAAGPEPRRVSCGRATAIRMQCVHIAEGNLMQCNRFAELAQVYKGGLLPPEMQPVLSHLVAGTLASTLRAPGQLKFPSLLNTLPLNAISRV